jgi:hypothetical protein
VVLRVLHSLGVALTQLQTLQNEDATSEVPDVLGRIAGVGPARGR